MYLKECPCCGQHIVIRTARKGEVPYIDCGACGLRAYGNSKQSARWIMKNATRQGDAGDHQDES